MHPQCWMMYVTHSAHSARGAGHGLSTRGRLHVQCPTCRRAVAGEFELEASSGGRVRREQYERLVVPGSEPGGPPAYVPRVPRNAFPEHVDREDGRLRDPVRDERRERGTPRASSKGGAPTDPAPARSPPRPQGNRDAPFRHATRSPATGDGRPAGRSGSGGGGGQGIGLVGGRGIDDGGGRQSGDGRELDRARDRGPSGSLVLEQIEARLTHGGMAVLGEVMRCMANNPDLRQIFFGGLGNEVRGGARPPRHAAGGARAAGSRSSGLMEVLVIRRPPLPSRAIRLGRGIAEAPGRPGKTRRNYGLWHVGRRVHRGFCAA